jgi:hypothetical protein
MPRLPIRHMNILLTTLMYITTLMYTICSHVAIYFGIKFVLERCFDMSDGYVILTYTLYNFMNVLTKIKN